LFLWTYLMCFALLKSAFLPANAKSTRNSAIADKPRDAFTCRGQSRSPNMVPFDMLGTVS